MPNDVYETARLELTTALSSRAAERVLAEALAAVDVTPEAVTPRQMRALLTGPIQRDLRGIMPPAGLTTILRRATAELRRMSESPAGGRDTDPRVGATSPAEPDRSNAGAPGASPRSSAAESDVRASDGVGRASRAIHAAPAPGPAVAERNHALPSTPSRPPAPAPFLEAALDLDRLSDLARTFARLEHVTGVAVVRDGEARFVRGYGLDAERAARLVPVAAQVMARQGPWRSYSLVHDRGQMFILPIGKDHLVLVGRAEFNLGAVLTALETLEEAL